MLYVLVYCEKAILIMVQLTLPWAQNVMLWYWEKLREIWEIFPFGGIIQSHWCLHTKHIQIFWWFYLDVSCGKYCCYL